MDKSFAGAVVIAVLLAVVGLVGLIVWPLWNALCPDLFGLPRISFLQAIGLAFLAQALFGHHSSVSKKN